MRRFESPEVIVGIVSTARASTNAFRLLSSTDLFIYSYFKKGDPIVPFAVRVNSLRFYSFEGQPFLN